jgi:hypothetical protein
MVLSRIFSYEVRCAFKRPGYVRSELRLSLTTAIAALTACTVWASETPRVLAQSSRHPCPKIETDATAAEQALCWFKHELQNGAQCRGSGGNVSQCISQATAWCNDAALDNGSVADACFLAYIRAGQFDEAISVAGYFQNPADQAHQCRAALVAVTTRVVTNPAGAQISIDGKRYGQAPVEVTLTGNWWTKEVKAVFEAGSKTVEVLAKREQLIAAFDKRACAMGDLLIEGPVASAEPLPSTVQQFEPGEGTDHGRSALSGRLWTWVALGGAVAFGGSAIYFGLKGDSQYKKLKDIESDTLTGAELDRRIDQSGAKTSALLTNLSLGLSGACLATAAILYFVEGADRSALSEVPIGARLNGVVMTGRF